MQQQLFTEEIPLHHEKASLVISKPGKAILTKNQMAFNKLTARIEKLHKEIGKKETQFDAAMNIYSTGVHPMRQQIALHKRELLNILWPIFKRREISKNDLGYLKKFLKECLEAIIQSSTDEPDAELKMIFRELEGESYEVVKVMQEAIMKEEVQEMFDDMDIDLDLNDIDITGKDFAEKMAEAQQQMKEKAAREQQQYQHRQKQKKKTTKELEKEKLQQAVDEMKQKNISTIYRQLAKLFHPDLEQDAERRVEKEELMKQLTAAYESKNLHALLSLELKWIHKENDHLASLTEEKLAVYLQILREQASGLEREKYQIPYKPQYMVIIQEFGPHATSQPLVFMNRELQHLESSIEGMKADLINFRSANALKHIKNMIKDYKQRNDDDDNMYIEELMLMLRQ